MQACHWKAHNTFTNFYLKDLTWSDNDNNMYLGPVVAAQVLDPSPQHRHLREERGGGPPAATKSSGVFPRVLVSVTFPDVHGKVFLSFNFYLYNVSLIQCTLISF